jgi:hypothetical protein
MSEPQVQIKEMSPFAEMIEATDESGRSLLPDYAWQAQWVRHAQASYREFTGVLRPQLPVGKKLATLRGALHVRVSKVGGAAQVEELAVPFEFKDLPMP